MKIHPYIKLKINIVKELNGEKLTAFWHLQSNPSTFCDENIIFKGQKAVALIDHFSLEFAHSALKVKGGKIMFSPVRPGSPSDRVSVGSRF